jgi:hypothetical protein
MKKILFVLFTSLFASLTMHGSVVLPTSAQTNTTSAGVVAVTVTFDGLGNVILSGAGNINAASAPVFAFDGNPLFLAADTLTAPLGTGAGQAGTLSSPYVGSFTINFEAFKTYNSATGLGITAADNFAHNNTGLGVEGTPSAGQTGVGEAMVVSVSGLTAGYTLVLTDLLISNFTAGTDNSVVYNSNATTFVNTTSGTQTYSPGQVTATSGHWFTLTQTTGDGIRMDTLSFDIIPEPSSALLGALGLLALLRRRR